jgi:hypothetical protein
LEYATAGIISASLSELHPFQHQQSNRHQRQHIHYRVDFAPAGSSAGVDTNLYNMDGVLTSNRTVTLNSKTLNFQGFGNVAMTTVGTFDVTPVSRGKVASSGELDLSGQTLLRVRTPNVNSSTAQVGQALVLQSMNNADGTVGKVEFQSVAGSPAIIAARSKATMAEPDAALNWRTVR